MSSAFGGSRTVSKSPEKGVFPLDHLGECKQASAMAFAHPCSNMQDQASHYARNIGWTLMGHWHLLAQVAQQYLACVEGNDGNAEPCIKLAKTYLECRMDRWAVLGHGVAG